MIDGESFFDQPIKNVMKANNITTGQGDEYTPSCLLDYNCFKEHYKMTAIDLSKQQVLDADPKSIEQINFSGNLGAANNRVMFLVIEEAKETI